MSNSEQLAVFSVCDSLHMEIGFQILAVELDGDDGVIITFSDGTTAGYVIEELLDLRPVRERVKITKSSGSSASAILRSSLSSTRPLRSPCR